MLLRVLLFFVLNIVVLAAAGPITKSINVGSPTVVVGVITSIATLLLTILFVRWDRVSLRDVGAAPGSRSLPRFVIGFALGLVLVAIHVSIEALFGHVSWVRSTTADSSGILLSLLTYLLLACREELAFRGYPLRRLNSTYGLWIAQIIVAVVFALEHVAGGATWTNAFLGSGVGSLLFGMAAIATNGLAVPIGLHAAWNFGDWMHGGKDSTGPFVQVIADGFTRRAELVAMLGYIVVTLGATAAFLWWYRNWRAEA